MQATDENKKAIVIDVDGTLCREKTAGLSYAELEPDEEVAARLREYRRQGFYIIIYSSRQMRTFNRNLGKINAETLPVLVEWLNRHQIPYDEIHVGKPWCGFEGFYVDDKSIRPDEFINLSYEEIQNLLKK